MRARRISAFDARYIENINLFDHVILNYTRGRPDEMCRQMRNILNCSPDQEQRHLHSAYPPIFVVAAPPAAGKGTLMETLRAIGSDCVKALDKMGKRDPRDTDKRDGMTAIGKNGTFPAEFDLRWRFHVPEEAQNDDEGTEHAASSHKLEQNHQSGLPKIHSAEEAENDDKGTEYAISSRMLEQNLQSGTPQIFISNMQQFDRFRERYGRHAVFVYLHRYSPEKVVESHIRNVSPDEADTKIREVRKVYRDYIEQIAEFDHVLLNTTHPEDLYDQMFQILEFHEETEERRLFSEWRQRRGR